MRIRPDGGLRVSAWRAVAGSCAAALIGAATVAMAATPAFADDPTDLRVKVDTGDIKLSVGGEQQVVNATVANDGPAGVSAPVLTIAVPLSSGGVTVAGTQPVSCTPVGGPAALTCQLPAMAPGQSLQFSLALVPPADGADGPAVREEGSFTISNPNGPDTNESNNSAPFRSTLSTRSDGVTEVAGTVVNGDTNGPLGGVQVAIKDSAGVQGQATTDANGAFTYRPDARTPLKSGLIVIDATKGGFDAGHTVVDGSSGGQVTGIQLALSPVPPPPSPSPSPEPSPSPSPAVAQKIQDESGDSNNALLVVVIVSVLSTAVLTGAGLWVGLRRNRDNDPNRAPDGPTVRISDDELRRAQAAAGVSGAPVDAATQVIGSGGYQPYQPAAGGYQPAAGGYQPAAGGGYPPPPPHAGPAYPPPPDRTTVYEQAAPLQPQPQPPAAYPPPQQEALFGAVPSAAGHETTALTPPSGPAAPAQAPVQPPRAGQYGPSSPAAPFGVSPAQPFGAPQPTGGQHSGPPSGRVHDLGAGSPWHSDPLTAPMPSHDAETSLSSPRWAAEDPPGPVR